MLSNKRTLDKGKSIPFHLSQCRSSLLQLCLAEGKHFQMHGAHSRMAFAATGHAGMGLTLRGTTPFYTAPNWNTVQSVTFSSVRGAGSARGA